METRDELTANLLEFLCDEICDDLWVEIALLHRKSVLG